MNFIKSMKVSGMKRIQCPHCKKHLAGDGHLKRHVRTIHKEKTLKN